MASKYSNGRIKQHRVVDQLRHAAFPKTLAEAQRFQKALLDRLLQEEKVFEIPPVRNITRLIYSKVPLLICSHLVDNWKY